jgi:hypothetical protein
MPIKIDPALELTVNTSECGRYGEIHISTLAMGMAFQLSKEELEELHIMIGLHLEQMK